MAPDPAKIRPVTALPVPTETDAAAKMVPLKTEAVLRVAELPTCQKILQALASFVSVTLLSTDVVKVEGI